MPIVSFLIVSVLALLILLPQLASAELAVVDIALAEAVQDRNPVDPITPPAVCEKDKAPDSTVPVVDSMLVPQIFFWTRIASDSDATVLHSWHHKENDQWVLVAEVDFQIHPSSGYRVWSSKLLDPALHTGEWMIVVAPADQPDHVLCITRFTVK
ncbi:MAG: DUF2914 domain-containing protein [Nitrospirae bacterium]|nr:MAG: DUF2914 domain-containing protein [Nitrospirota bacterium]